MNVSHRIMLIVSHVLVLTAGAALGAWGAVYMMGRANGTVADIGAIDRMSSYVAAQRMLGDQAAYDAALRNYLTWLERRRATHSPLSDERAILTDIALTHARLALLAEGRGDAEAAESHFKNALAQCPGAFTKLCSRESLRSTVVRLDRPIRRGEADKG